jgi:hypothetical protein
VVTFYLFFLFFSASSAAIVFDQMRKYHQPNLFKSGAFLLIFVNFCKFLRIFVIFCKFLSPIWPQLARLIEKEKLKMQK